jgi:hypothetical protein
MVTRSRKSNWKGQIWSCSHAPCCWPDLQIEKILFPISESRLRAAVHQNPEGPSLKTEFESHASSGSYSIQSQHQYSRAKPNWLLEAWFWSRLLLAHQVLPQNFKIFDLAHTKKCTRVVLRRHPVATTSVRLHRLLISTRFN